MKRGCNPSQLGNRFAHRAELRDLGWWFYFQRNRVTVRWERAVKRVERARRVTTTRLLGDNEP